jgi:hypothetical protein
VNTRSERLIAGHQTQLPVGQRMNSSIDHPLMRSRR